MSAFEDEFEIPAASEVDPAAEFLAKEQVESEMSLWLVWEIQMSLWYVLFQEELGDIGQDLGLGAPAQTEDVLAPANEEEDVSVYFIFFSFYSLLTVFVFLNKTLNIYLLLEHLYLSLSALISS